jgi:hypothetical protein
MTKKASAAKKVPRDYARKEFVLKEPVDGDVAGAIAKALTRPEVGAAAIIEHWQRDTHDVNALADELRRQVELVNSGDLSRPEGMLIAQAHALSEIFVNLSRRAMDQQYLKQWEAHMRMGLKAQSQCRMTLETLATIKNPPAIFARQANINNGGQQQVNNGTAAPRLVDFRGGSRAGNPEAVPSGLLEANDGSRMDTSAEGAAISGDSEVAPVGAFNRAEDR